jgi:outer membrane protein assembly factor BamE
VGLLRYVLLTGLFVLVAGVPGCDLEHHRLMKEQYHSYPEGIRRTIDRGNIIRGMNQDQVYLALGAPVCKKDVQDQGKPVTVWLYPPIGRDACITADFRVYFEDGTVTTWDRFTIPTRYTDPPGGAP